MNYYYLTHCSLSRKKLSNGTAKRSIIILQLLRAIFIFAPIYMSLATLEQYSNPKRVLKLAKQYYKQHTPLECNRVSRTNKAKGVLIGKLGPSSAGLYVSTRKNKKYMLFNGCKTVHFGQLPYEDFTKHRNLTRRKNYLQRATNIKGDWKKDAYSPNMLAIHLLW